MSFFLDIVNSWKNIEGSVNSTDDLLNWIDRLNKTTFVKINECSINSGNFWFYEWYVENGDTRTLANLQVLQSKLNHPRQ